MTEGTEHLPWHLEFHLLDMSKPVTWRNDITCLKVVVGFLQYFDPYPITRFLIGSQHPTRVWQQDFGRN